MEFDRASRPLLHVLQHGRGMHQSQETFAARQYTRSPSRSMRTTEQYHSKVGACPQLAAASGTPVVAKNKTITSQDASMRIVSIATASLGTHNVLQSCWDILSYGCGFNRSFGRPRGKDCEASGNMLPSLLDIRTAQDWSS